VSEKKLNKGGGGSAHDRQVARARERVAGPICVSYPKEAQTDSSHVRKGWERTTRWSKSDGLAFALACGAAFFAVVCLYFQKTQGWVIVTHICLLLLAIYPVWHFCRGWELKSVAYAVITAIVAAFGWYNWPVRPKASAAPLAIAPPSTPAIPAAIAPPPKSGQPSVALDLHKAAASSRLHREIHRTTAGKMPSGLSQVNSCPPDAQLTFSGEAEISGNGGDGIYAPGANICVNIGGKLYIRNNVGSGIVAPSLPPPAPVRATDPANTTTPKASNPGCPNGGNTAIVDNLTIVGSRSDAVVMGPCDSMDIKNADITGSKGRGIVVVPPPMGPPPESKQPEEARPANSDKPSPQDAPLEQKCHGKIGHLYLLGMDIHGAPGSGVAVTDPCVVVIMDGSTINNNRMNGLDLGPNSLPGNGIRIGAPLETKPQSQ
jgi:hypothetical protein